MMRMQTLAGNLHSDGTGALGPHAVQTHAHVPMALAGDASDDQWHDIDESQGQQKSTD